MGGGTDGDSWEKPPLRSRRGADGSARHKSQTIYKASKTNQKITSPKSKCRTNLLLSVRSRKTKGLCLPDGQTQTDAVSSLNKDLKTETAEAVRMMMQLSSPSGNFLLKAEIKNLRLSLFVSVSLTSRVSQSGRSAERLSLKTSHLQIKGNVGAELRSETLLLKELLLVLRCSDGSHV